MRVENLEGILKDYNNDVDEYIERFCINLIVEDHCTKWTFTHGSRAKVKIYNS